MGQSTIDAVLAGTKSFAVALLAPLTARIGNRPRLAADPSQVLGLCSGPSALAVVEFTGEGSLGTIQALVRDGKGLRVVAGVPTAHAGAEGTLLALGVEVGRWDGKIDGVVLAVERAVTAMASSPSSPAPPRPAVAAPRPAPAAAAPRPSSPAAAPAAPKPAAVAPGRADSPGPAAAAAPVAPRPPAGAARPAAAPPPAASPARPAAVPAAPAAKAAARGVSAAAPGPAPQRSGPPQAPPRAAPAAPPPAAEPPPPMLSRQPALAPPAAPAAAPAPVAAPAPSSRPPATFFDDMEGDDVSIDEEPLPAKPVALHAPGIYVPPPPTARVDWPAGICSDAEASDALRRALDGKTDAQPLDALAAKVIEAASDLERAVLKGEPQPFEVTAIRKATVIRLRVAEALATAPATVSAVDTAALSTVLGQIDGLLAEVAPLLQAAPAEFTPALESIRNSLVSEAIDFSEAAARLGKQEPVADAAPRPAPSARPGSARMVVVDDQAGAEIAKAERRRAWVAYVILGVAVLLAVGYHGWRQSMARSAKPQAGVVGAPANSVSATGSGKVQIIVSKTGKFDPADVQRLRGEQELKGNRVEEIAPGVLKISPAAEPRKN